MTTSSAASQRAALIERFTASGQPFEMGERMVRGVPMRVYTTGPLTLRDIALASTGAADRPFLICRDERWSYAASVVTDIATSDARHLQAEEKNVRSSTLSPSIARSDLAAAA